MSEQEIYADLTKIFREVFDDDELTLRPELSASDVEGWDSLAHVRLMLTIQNHFKSTYPLSKVANLKNVGELVQLVKSHLRE